MAAPANTFTTAAAKSLKEDLADVFFMLEPTETPMVTALGKPKTAKAVTHSWLVDTLNPASDDNAVIEGADPDTDAGDDGDKLSNICQLMDKVAQVSSTAEAVESVAGAAAMKRQIAKRAKELKLDVEKTVLSNRFAVPGDAATAPRLASLISFLKTNVSRGAGGANPTLSAANQGYPNAAPVDGTQRAFAESQVKAVMQSCFNEGAKPTLIFMGAFNKGVFSGFTGNAQKTKDVDDKKVVGAVDIYVSDFGDLKAVPSRHIRPRDTIILDPRMAWLAFLQPVKHDPLAKSGHSERRMVSCQVTLGVGNEKAHAHIADLTTS